MSLEATGHDFGQLPDSMRNSLLAFTEELGHARLYFFCMELYYYIFLLLYYYYIIFCKINNFYSLDFWGVVNEEVIQVKMNSN